MFSTKNYSFKLITTFTLFIATLILLILIFKNFEKNYYVLTFQEREEFKRCNEKFKLTNSNCIKNATKDDNKTIVKVDSNIYPTVNNDLKFLLQHAAEELLGGDISYDYENRQNDKFQKNKEIVYVTFVTTSTKFLLRNWLCNIHYMEHSLNKKNLLKRILLISLDPDACEEVTSKNNLSCLYIPSNKKANEAITKEDVLQKWNIFIFDIINTLLNSKISVFYFETKDIWLKDPYPLLNNTTLIDDADVVLPMKLAMDQPYHFYKSPILVHYSKASKMFLNELKTQLLLTQENDITSDNSLEIINNLCQTSYYGVVCREFYENEICDIKECNIPSNTHNVYNQTIILNNFPLSISDSRKYALIKHNKMWFLNVNLKENDPLECSFLKVKEFIS
uniref:Nucleotid_trans domain-containing protein n=1 Tax=Parastrongyloides trichosuri TaxID=131310 RepID=A0A0N5A0J1_PARTI